MSDDILTGKNWSEHKEKLLSTFPVHKREVVARVLENQRQFVIDGQADLNYEHAMGIMEKDHE